MMMFRNNLRWGFYYGGLITYFLRSHEIEEEELEMTVAWHPELTAKLVDRIGGRSVTDDAMDALAECYPLRDSASYLCKTSPTFLETADGDELTSDEAMDDEEENDALDEANALMMFDRGDDEY
ncbi:hypothetical protein EJD97_012785 [Solanum chilense]|uniref:Uncharacterized protein n=1 Tax=Solanum chilense TaxID=4083 RepID=A0A6N2AEZ2_SOLCI|nr:hypothetical protein EJD97_012785 [Solanum chilense]